MALPRAIRRFCGFYFPLEKLVFMGRGEFGREPVSSKLAQSSP